MFFISDKVPEKKHIIKQKTGFRKKPVFLKKNPIHWVLGIIGFFYLNKQLVG